MKPAQKNNISIVPTSYYTASPSFLNKIKTPPKRVA